MRAFLMLVAMVCALPFVAHAQSSKPKIEIRDAWARLPADGGKSTTVYAYIVNLTSETDRLLGASSPWADRIVFQHNKMKGYDMIAKVVPSIKIGARQLVKLDPGEYYLRLEALTQQLVPDQKIPVTLRFQDVGRVVMEASISNQKIGNMDIR